MKLVVSTSPNVKNPTDTAHIMKHVILALLPATFCGAFFFGLPAVITIVTSVASAIIIEAIINMLKNEPLTIYDGSAALTGLLLALVLPPVIPVWMVFIGNIVAIGIAKHAFGGLGHNIFNPALTARLFLMVSYPVTLTTWQQPANWFNFSAMTSATALAKETAFNPPLWNLFMGIVPGSIGETSVLALLIGAAWLIYKQIIDLKSPLAFFTTIVGFSLLTGQSPAFHLFAGGAIIGGFFMLTDYVTSPMTKIGRIIFGVATGILVMCLRLWSNMPEGVAFSIVLMNAFVPLFDQLGMALYLKFYNRIYQEPS